jgi:DNA-binding XRE family transcriptional regulator
MENSVDRSHSAFRELRQAVGLKQSHVARVLGVSRETVAQWDAGGRPGQWRYIPELAKLLGWAMEEATRFFWHENLGDPCPCGCGGKKVIPQPITSKRARQIDYNKATHLYIALRCEKCPTVRIYDQEQGHFPLCRRCSYVSRGFSAPNKLPCIGSNPHPTTVPLDRRPHADGCPREEWVSRKRIKSKTKPGHRSEECRRVVNRVRQRETLVREFLNDAEEPFLSSPESRKYFEEVTGFAPHQRVRRIRSLDQLTKREKACNKLSDEAQRRGFKLRVFNPNRFQPGHKTVVRRRRENSDSQRKGMFLHYAKREVTLIKPNTEEKLQRGEHMKIAGSEVKGICRFCREPMVSTKRGVEDHLACYLNRGKVIPPETKRGRPKGSSPGNMRKHYNWMMRRAAGQTLGDIAEKFHVERPTVVEGIDDIKSRLNPVKASKKIREKWRFLGIFP